MKLATLALVRTADLPELAESWVRHLRTGGRPQTTIEVYLRPIRGYVAATDDDAEVDRPHLVAYLSELSQTVAPATMRVRFRALSLFMTWLEDEGEIPANPIRGMKPPAAPASPVPVLTDDQLVDMLNACKTEVDEFHRRRAEALLRCFIETGCRLGEVAGLKVDDVDLRGEMLSVLGKGNKPRRVPLGPRSANALDRYLRARKKHRDAASPMLWLGLREPLGQDGIDAVLRKVAARAGVDAFHVHRLRHTYAHRFLKAGGQERSLMTLAGWSSPAMLARYGATLQEERALDEARRLGLGEI